MSSQGAHRWHRLRVAGGLAVLVAAQQASAVEITVHADRPGAAVSPTLYGAFFEDINRAGDGGLYAEMVQNRSFEDSSEPIFWSTTGTAGTIALDKSTPLNSKNPTSLKLQITAGGGRFGVVNEGFKGVPLTGKSPTEAALKDWAKRSADAAARSTEGMYVVEGKQYDLTLYARSGDLGTLTASLEKADGTVLATQALSGVGAEWKKFEAHLVAGAGDGNARLVIAGTSPGTVWLDMISLFPRETYKNRPNGWRPDLVEMMQNLHPGLLRFPGGSFSEGAVLADAWRWKETIGDVAERGSNWNIWGYRTTNGIGFHEYLQLAEDLGAQPLYVAHVGMAEKGFVPLDQLEPWIQDALDAIEYANGPATSKWGALRARAGHPEPFNLKYVEIGNENGMGYSWGGGTRADHLPRYKAFHERIKKTYPDIVTIANIHTEPDAPADLVDEHYYESSDWFFKNASLYDTYDRNKPKLYLGEYAAKNDAGNGNLREALAEAAFLTGLERNADVVLMSSFAPLFSTPGWQRWKPDAVVFNNSRAFGTPSYHMMAMFGANRPDVVVPVDLPQAAGTPTLFASAGLKKETGELILKLVNSAAQPLDAQIQLQGPAFGAGEGLELASAALTDENSFATPERIAPRPLQVNAAAGKALHTLPPYSVTVLRWKKRN